MFFITQLIGLAVINAYSPKKITILNETTGKLEEVITKPQLPYGMQPPEELEKNPKQVLTSIVIAFTIAVLLIFLLMKIRAVVFLKLWFFFVVLIALSITLNTLTINLKFSSSIAFLIALPFAYLKIFKRNFLVHNLTELLIYPGIAAVFVPILNLWAVIILLLLISVYDIYAVWHSGFMQKMAKFQINKLNIFAGFFVPYMNKKTREKIRFLKQKYKNKKISEKTLKSKKIKVNFAILGGGDVVFPIILAGVILRLYGFLPALIISIFATLSLLYLFIKAEKGKFYPAMPFLTAGCLIGLAVNYFFSYFI